MKTATNKQDSDMTHIKLDGTTTQHLDALMWLEDNMGKDTWKFRLDFPSDCVTYSFNCPKDAMLFRLKWKP